MIHSEDRELLEAFLASELQGEQAEAVELRLRVEDDLARLMIEVSCQEAVTQEWVTLQQNPEWAFLLPGQTPRKTPYSSFAKLLTAATVTLAVIAAFWVGVYFRTPPPSPVIVNVSSTPVVEKVAVAKAVLGRGGSAENTSFAVNERLQTRHEYFWKEGLLKLQMDSGAEISVQGPANFHLLDSNTLYLLRGTMTATVPPAAIGFEVKSPTMTIVDLGTRFGVHVDEEGLCETHVFQGVVNYFESEEKEFQDSPTRLTAGQSARRQVDGSIAKSEKINSSLFAVCLHDQFGITTLSEQVTFIPVMPEAVALGNYQVFEHDHVAFLFPEKRSVLLAEDFLAEIGKPGVYQSEEDVREASQLIPVGTTVDCFCIYYDPLDKSEDLVAVQGEVHFDRPILGIVGSEQNLLASDRLFRPEDKKSEKKIKRQGIEFTRQDEITISEDRRTLFFNLKTRGGVADEFRILVQSQEKPSG